MHWSSEWAEQHYDISSTTSPPAHAKPLSYLQPGHPAFSGYSDDISALSASTLLKRYAERYSFSLPVYPESSIFHRNEPTQDAWSIGYNPEGIEGIKGNTNNYSEPFSTGALSQDYTSNYRGPHYPRPTYLTQPAFALPPTYPSTAPVYTYSPGMTTSSSPSRLASGLHPPLNSSIQSIQDPTLNRTFGLDQTKSASVSPYTVSDKSDQPGSVGNGNSDLQNFRPDRILSQADLKVELVKKSNYLQPHETPSYGGPEQYSYH